MYASLTLFIHPKRRPFSPLLRARRLAKAAAALPGIEFARALQTGNFRTDPLPPFIPGRVAVMLWAPDESVLDEVDKSLLAPLADGASERWRVLLVPASVHGGWSGFAPICDGVEPIKPDEPVVVLIHGVLRARYLNKFTRDNAAVGRQLAGTEGYLGGLAMADTPLTTASFSCWCKASDSKKFAFAAGIHRDAYQIDRKQGRHSTEFFVRFRPVRSEGSFDGKDPLAKVLNLASK